MKNLISRVLALILVLSVLLMPVSALAAERNAGTLTIGNLELTMDDQTISLPIQLQIGGGADLENERGFGILNVLTSDATALSAMAAIENGEVKAYLNGMSYGLSMPLEQVIASLSSAIESSTGATVEDLLAEAGNSLSSEMQAAVVRLTTAYTALLAETATALPTGDPTTYLKEEVITNTLGGTVTWSDETQTIDLFDVQAEANLMTVSVPTLTYSQLISKFSADYPALKEYYDAYIALMNLALTESGEEAADFQALLDQISFSMDGIVYSAENGAYAELYLTVTVNEDGDSMTIELPCIVTTLADEAGVYCAVDVIMEVDGEALYVSVYTDDFVSEGYDCTTMDIMIAVGDLDAEEPETAILFSVYSMGDEESDMYGLDIGVSEGDESMSIGGYYYALPAVCTEESDSYDGFIQFYANDGSTNIEFYLDTNLTLTSVPEGELLTFTTSINPLEADEATMEQLANDAMIVLYQGLGVLMQDPTIAALMGAAE